MPTCTSTVGRTRISITPACHDIDAENASAGTDHGHGNFMLVMGGEVNGGQVYADWPTLAPEALNEGDLAITTDYRSVLSEILIRRLQNPNLGYIFPGYTSYQPTGIVQGADLPPNYETPTGTPTPGSTIPSGTGAQIYLPVIQR